MPTIQNIQKTVEVPQVQFIDKDTVEIHVVLQRQVLVIQKVQKAVAVHQVQQMDRNVDVKVVFQHKITDKTVSTEDGGSVQSHC